MIFASSVDMRNRITSKLLAAFVVLFSLSACVDVSDANLNSNNLSNDTKRCFDCDTYQLLGESSIEVSVREIRGLDQSCQVAADCVLVSLDIVCEKSFISIADHQAEAYTAIVNQYFEQNSEPHYCSDEWSPRFDINNYESQCVQNQCRAVYLGSSH
jgi:hypothetical protein